MNEIKELKCPFCNGNVVQLVNGLVECQNEKCLWDGTTTELNYHFKQKEQLESLKEKLNDIEELIKKLEKKYKEWLKR